jgi:hypothetical protein
VASSVREPTAESLTTHRLEALLSARLFLQPQLTDGRLYFISNLSGRLSLYAMDEQGGVPEPLLPPQLALQNPELVEGHSFHVLPDLGRIVVMVDHDGDENYEPFLIPIEGGFTEPLAAEAFKDHRSHLVSIDPDAGIAYFAAESRSEPVIRAIRCDLASGEVEVLGESMYGAVPLAYSPDHSRVVLLDEYLLGDSLLYEPDGAGGRRRTLYGTPLGEREEGREYPLSGIRAAHVTTSGTGVLVVATVFDDVGSPGYLSLEGKAEMERVEVVGVVHDGVGELEDLEHLEADRYAAIFNIDGCSWAYDGRFDEPSRRLKLERCLVGEGDFSGGVLHGLDLDRSSGRFAVAFSTATTPTQLYVLESAADPAPRTRERALGLAPELLAAGEDASFDSHDGLRVSARASTSRPPSSATRGRGRSCTTCTAAHRAKSGPTSRGSRSR